MAECPECGASERDGLTCRQQWDQLLALEFSDPRAGSVHLLTVACYQLQHPRSFPLQEDARRGLEGTLRDVVVHGRPVSEVRDAMRGAYDGSRRVRGAADAASPVRRWSRTVADVGPPDAQHHAERVREWALAVIPP